MSTKSGFRTMTYMDLGLGGRVFRGRDKDTESFYYPIYCILWISFHLVLLCIALFFSLPAACDWTNGNSLGVASFLADISPHHLHTKCY